MPMRRFGMFVGHARKISDRKRDLFLLELNDIAGASVYTSAYHQGLKEHYRMRLLNEKQKQKVANPRTFDVEDREQADQAASILMATFRTKKKLMGLDGVRN